MALIASRVTLIQLESKDAAGAGVRRIAYLIAVIAAVIFAWALLMAGLVGILSEAIEKPWSWVAVGFALLHLLAGLVLAKLAKPAGAPAFPITRAEFQKDREWIENFNQTRKSND